MSEVNNQIQVIERTCLQWEDYQNQFSGVVRQLLDENCMVDVTLCVSGQRILAHRIVLCAFSTFFKDLLSQVTDDHPVIILTGVAPECVKGIIEFIYQGEAYFPADSIKNILDTAFYLKIAGLMEYKISETVSKLKEDAEEIEISDTNLNEMEEEEVLDVFEHVYEEANDQSEQSATEENSESKKRKRRYSMKREYSEDMLAAAINNLREGQTLIEAATKNHIPRSTLYMRAKALGIQLQACRNEYPAECMKGAIDAVIGGSSLQTASEMFGIPKTVLWRRMQKEGYQVFRPELKRSYGSDKREAAVKALERGENLSKVAQEYQIPKTTLFRDKTKLIDQGKLPTSFWKKRKTENEAVKQFRLEEAVAACKSGKMSQAAASVCYRIPKTTIWRRLQQDNSKIKRKTKSTGAINASANTIDANEFTFCEVTSGIPITYIDENSIPEDSVIILTTEDVDELSLENRAQIIVNSNVNEEFISNSEAEPTFTVSKS